MDLLLNSFPYVAALPFYQKLLVLTRLNVNKQNFLLGIELNTSEHRQPKL